MLRCWDVKAWFEERRTPLEALNRVESNMRRLGQDTQESILGPFEECYTFVSPIDEVSSDDSTRKGSEAGSCGHT
jgi:hypothetical protein